MASWTRLDQSFALGSEEQALEAAIPEPSMESHFEHVFRGLADLQLDPRPGKIFAFSSPSDWKTMPLFVTTQDIPTNLGLKADKPVTPTFKQRTGFLNLPAELRNDIYYLAVLNEAPIPACIRSVLRPKSVKATGAVTRRRVMLEPAIAFTCRQVRTEVLPIYYAENIFRPWPCGSTLTKDWINDMLLWHSRSVATCDISHTEIILKCWPADRGYHRVRVRFSRSRDGELSIRPLESDAEAYNGEKLCFRNLESLCEQYAEGHGHGDLETEMLALTVHFVQWLDRQWEDGYYSPWAICPHCDGRIFQDGVEVMRERGEIADTWHGFMHRYDCDASVSRLGKRSSDGFHVTQDDTDAYWWFD